MDPRRLQQAHRQDNHRIRHDWGLPGAHAISTGADVAVVIDVLSFTTTLSVATDAGIEVLPYRWADDGATKLAADHQAVLAVGRRTARPGQISLSASTVRAADPPPKRLVLPSPNGSMIAHHLADRAGVVIGACLRNATSAAAWINAHYDHQTASVAVISAGERWPDGSLRPAVEDLWGAGAVLDALTDLGWRDLSPEAVVAGGAFRAVAAEVPRQLAACASGRELGEAGFGNDVDVAAEVDEGSTVPVHDGHAFIAG
ncbi:2-phosphosulfolactate phosphatase [Quadrisphaera granulorum]|uniref:Probable 2-phosphosulfolactate phosphatase n=1 Tax=Quadrisphaera granulorum TaxID=317664 RepID=A0A316A6S0_9ACTN|nr:2-phosphosulfolactate phosphatase [Quadrisphaera granulorum]PWJ52514.1 2-phosphosulfolactate phosphatase [Quadrisphaera granulorum]SZE97564.1 2-phosphosulfolactate phosphatase [Quadrisphaera granulorum]